MNNIRYYIGTGALKAMYTLRMLADDFVYISTGEGQHERIQVLRDWYICNLSTNIEKANKKALAQIDGPLISGAEVVGELNAYQERMKGLSTAEQERIDQERAEAERQATQARNDKLIGIIAEGKMPFGHFKGARFENIPLSYLKYWATMDTQEAGDAVVITLQTAIFTRYPQLANLPEVTGGWIEGEPKTRLTKECTLLDVIPYESQFGGGYILKYVTTEGQSLTWFASRPPQEHDIGDLIKLKFTIKAKDHDSYNDNIETTLINRGVVQ